MGLKCADRGYSDRESPLLEQVIEQQRPVVLDVGVEVWN